VFWVALYWFPDFIEFMELEVGQTELTWAHNHQGAPPLGAPWCLVPHVSAFWLSPKASRVSFVQKKIIKKFHGIWTSFGIDFLENQKQAENSNWHWALS
jgi:hypothetical protein